MPFSNLSLCGTSWNPSKSVAFNVVFQKEREAVIPSLYLHPQREISVELNQILKDDAVKALDLARNKFEKEHIYIMWPFSFLESTA